MSRYEETWKRPFNKKATKFRNLRMGVTVDCPKGKGIVTYRGKPFKKDVVEVAVVPDVEGEVSPCYRYQYSPEDVTISPEPINECTRLYDAAWYWIMGHAVDQNAKYEIERHEFICAEYSSLIPGKYVDRDVSAGPWGSYKYRRYTGVNKNGDAFDFEMNIKRPFIPCGDRVLYALGKGDGRITDMNGHGWIYRRKITDNDINYGLAKYAGPQEEAE